jgi:hypothetical protein
VECPISATTGSAWALEILMSQLVEQNALKRRGVGLRTCDPERACPGFTLFAPVFEQNRTVYLINLQGELVHSWLLPYAPGLSGYLTERGTLLYNGRTSENNFLSRFPFKGGVVLEADWNGKCCGNYATQTTTTSESCCATETCC